MNLIVAVAIVLLNLYVASSISCQIPHVVLSIYFPDVSTSIYVEADSKVPHELHFCNKDLGDYIIQVLPWVYIVCLTGSQ